jgi:hypothetical protein
MAKQAEHIDQAPVVPPAAADMIRELCVHHTRLDPTNRRGFNSVAAWEWRLEAHGYLQLFNDWYFAVGSTARQGKQTKESDRG